MLYQRHLHVRHTSQLYLAGRVDQRRIVHAEPVRSDGRVLQ